MDMSWLEAANDIIERQAATIKRQAKEIEETRAVIAHYWANTADTAEITAGMSPEMQSVFYDVIGENLDA